ncbi:FkbM family methyltransferase [Sagittula marina]|uniref:FkbM family methyltransferase n=1 Tax=Sagittula marina TaxID=943940 RepID=A0A7W6DMY1_9RHOB|nr:FkbM family methyltransferase [Sagittula marina]MBB3986106.1 FkbM family methyltransferase [Sagittula marina]
MTDRPAKMKDQAVAALCKGVRVPFSPFLNDMRIKRMKEARYEGTEIAGALSIVREGDRVLEMGTGLGVVGAVIAHNAKPEAVLSFEANPNLIPHIKELYALNDLTDRMEVRNQIVLTGPDQPSTVTFHLRSTYLASSLIKSDNRKTTPVDVPTVNFAKLVRDFRPDVLVIDIEGGELDFLRHADLSTIRAMVIEFHPDHYGREGAVQCKDILRAAGFQKNSDVSTRFVWTCERRDFGAVPPDPDSGWSREIVALKDAFVVPPTERKHVQTTGVLTADGTSVAHANLWRSKRLLTVAPFRPAEKETKILPGKWLWGGTLWRYFPHFVTESITRLWALAQLDQSDFSGIIFVPKNPNVEGPPPSFQRAFLDLLDCTLDIHEARSPLIVENLVVPGQGFGLGEISQGTPEYRAVMAEKFASTVKPDGPEKLYISRSQLGPARGALLGEDRLEIALQAEGYEVFHPQQHSLEVQIARYRAAKKVIAAEGSALHLYAFVGKAETDVAVLLRRESAATGHIATHIESFTGAKPLLVNRLLRMWQRLDTPRKRLWIGEPDFAATQRDLIAGGFISDGPAWEQPAQADLQSALGAQYKLVTDTPQD